MPTSFIYNAFSIENKTTVLETCLLSNVTKLVQSAIIEAVCLKQNGFKYANCSSP